MRESRRVPAKRHPRCSRGDKQSLTNERQEKERKGRKRKEKNRCFDSQSSENILRGQLRSTRRQRSKQLNLAGLLPRLPSYRAKCTGDRRTIRSYRVDSRHVTFRDDRSRRYLVADGGFVVPLVIDALSAKSGAATVYYDGYKFIFRAIPRDNCP